MADEAKLSDPERARLEARRARLMELMREAEAPGGSPLDADDREDLMREWTRIDNLLQRG